MIGDGSGQRKESRRERHRRELMGQILRSARHQLEEKGPGGVSWRGVATEVGMNPASLYTYFDSLDALYTALIVDSHHALTTAVTEADAAEPRNDGMARVMACVRAHRSWAVSYPAQYNLITTDQIPGYQAPTGSPSTASELQQAQVMLGALEVATGRPYGDLQALAPRDLADFIGLSGLIHGLVSLEINHHLPFIHGPEELLLAQVHDHVTRLRDGASTSSAP